MVLIHFKEINMSNDLRIEELYNKNSKDFNLKEEQGLSIRIDKI